MALGHVTLLIRLLANWLQTVARGNPVTYAVDSMRILFNGTPTVPDTDATPLVTRTVLTLVLAARSLRRSVS